jgi:galactarate dehydratase
LTNIVETAMGSIIKSGTSPISSVVAPGERAQQKGLLYAAMPASDLTCGTLQLAAGMNMHVFTTGRCTPYGLAAMPVVKVATGNDLASYWHDLMDVNAARITSGGTSIEEVGWELFRLMLGGASGRRTWAGQRKLQNALVLFNPAPVTSHHDSRTCRQPTLGFRPTAVIVLPKTAACRHIAAILG